MQVSTMPLQVHCSQSIVLYYLLVGLGTHTETQYPSIEEECLLKPCKTLFINTPQIQKMYRCIRKRKKRECDLSTIYILVMYHIQISTSNWVAVRYEVSKDDPRNKHRGSSRQSRNGTYLMPCVMSTMNELALLMYSNDSCSYLLCFLGE
jgi:hypothetical protein